MIPQNFHFIFFWGTRLVDLEQKSRSPNYFVIIDHQSWCQLSELWINYPQVKVHFPTTPKSIEIKGQWNKTNLATAKNVLNISFTRPSHSRSNITTQDLYFARVSKMTTLLPNDGPLVSRNPSKVPTIKWKISCKQIKLKLGWRFQNPLISPLLYKKCTFRTSSV